MLQRRQMRYAHSSGHTDTCYSNDGKYIITCGSDGDVRIWLGLEDDDPSSVCAGEKAFSVRHSHKKSLENNVQECSSQIFVATDSFYVQALNFPDGDRNGVIARFTAPVSHLAIDKKEKILVAASQDMTIQVISLVDNKVITTLSELKGPALSVAICPNKCYVAVSAGDGILRIWTLESKTVVKEFNCIPKVNNFYDAFVLCRSCFEPTSGKSLVYPDGSNVHIVDTIKWENVMTLSDSMAEGDFSISEYSPCGQFIAASTTKGYISVWQVGSKKIMGSFSHPNKYAICALVWNPKGNGEFAFSDAMGQLGTVEGCMRNSSTSDDAVITENQDVFSEFTYDDDDDGENVISLEKIKNDTLGLNVDDIKDEELRSQSRSSMPVREQITIELQSPFQPGSSPSHLFERYMVWNDVGIIRAYENDSDKKTIDIEFHDTSIHHAMHLTNYLNHTIASLSSTVLALACESPSKLVCIPLSVGGSREWQVELPEGEEALCITASDLFIALATDARYLRLFTAYGTQREVLCIPGPVVALASKRTSLLVAYHSGIGNGSDQVISLLIIHIQGQNVTSTQIHVPLSPGALLMWLGHTDTGSPATFDSAGVLRIFTPRTSVWLPLYDHSKNQKNSSDGFFVVDVSESAQLVRGVLCKGSKYPQITPRPTLTEMNLHLPTCELSTEKNELEEKLARWNHCQVIQSDKANKEVAIKLFALACRSDLEQRALELVELLESPQILELAVKYAGRLGKIHLMDKLVRLAESWQEDNNILMNSAKYNIVNEVIENRAVAFDASRRQYAKTSSTECNTETLKPLELKKNSQKRIVLSETKSVSLTPQNNSIKEIPDNTEAQNSKENSDDSLLTLTPTLNKSRNPFSKKVTSVENESNPFNFTENFKKDFSEKNKEINKSNQEIKSLVSKEAKTNNFGFKRKQPETIDNTIEKSNKQSKLSVFAFKKNTD